MVTLEINELYTDGKIAVRFIGMLGKQCRVMAHGGMILGIPYKYFKKMFHKVWG